MLSKSVAQVDQPESNRKEDLSRVPRFSMLGKGTTVSTFKATSNKMDTWASHNKRHGCQVQKFPDALFIPVLNGI